MIQACIIIITSCTAYIITASYDTAVSILKLIMATQRYNNIHNYYRSAIAKLITDYLYLIR